MNPESFAPRFLQEENDAPEQETVIAPEEDTHYLSQSILTMLTIVAINAIVLNYVRRARVKYPKVARYVQDAPVTTLIGILAGLLLQVTGCNEILVMIGDGYLNFFMIILLPPILFESTINMHKKSFFRNIGTILMYAVLGTFIASCFTAVGIYLIGLTDFIREFEFTFEESFAFGSLISSTDPVSVLAIFKEMAADKTLYTLIFGESILNDAIAIVLYNTITGMSQEGHDQSFTHPIVHFILLLTGSIFIGFIIGLLSALILKVYFGRSENNTTANTETTLMIVIPWVAYLIGEAFDMSGVVTILFCGITMTKYALPYLSNPGKQLTQSLYSTISSTAENLVFIFIGIGFFSFEHHWGRLKWTILALSFIVIITARYIQVTIISFIANLFRTNNKITRKHQMVMIYSGFRGAMAFALATNAINVYTTDGAGSMMLTLTLVYATLTIFVQGTLLVPVMEYFGVAGKTDAESSVFDDEDPLKGTSWTKVKRVFIVAENFISRLFLRGRDEEKLNKQAFCDGINLSPEKNRELAMLKKETEVVSIRRIRSDSDATTYYGSQMQTHKDIASQVLA